MYPYEKNTATRLTHFSAISFYFTDKREGNSSRDKIYLKKCQQINIKILRVLFFVNIFFF